jgi:1,4-alpha-glucan branching enzyme
VVSNLTPVIRQAYRIGVPEGGRWLERLNTDATVFAGSGVGNLGAVTADPLPSHGHPQSLSLTLPPLSTLVLVRDRS